MSTRNKITREITVKIDFYNKSNGELFTGSEMTQIVEKMKSLTIGTISMFDIDEPEVSFFPNKDELYIYLKGDDE